MIDATGHVSNGFKSKAAGWSALLPKESAKAASALTLPPRPPEDGSTVPRLSFVVLPFANLSADPEQDYFAHGLTDDLTTDLSSWTGSPQAQKQFQSVRPATDCILVLAVCLGCAYLIAVMLPALWGLKGSPGLTGFIVAVTILAILAVYVCLRALWIDAEPRARIAIAAILVLAPAGYLLLSAIMSAIFIDLVVLAVVQLVRPDLAPLIFKNENLSIGATMLAMSIAIVVIFLLRRRTLGSFDALSFAARKVLVVAGLISFGGLVLLLPVLAVVSFIRQ
jgi:hypothetical protein